VYDDPKFLMQQSDVLAAQLQFENIHNWRVSYETWPVPYLDKQTRTKQNHTMNISSKIPTEMW
jgi:hypothetical protein